jgi:glycosyltransferase involved in cell wall biosynthesis
VSGAGAAREPVGDEVLRICMVAPYFPPFAPGGGEFSAAEQCRRLAAAGHRVAVVVPDFAGQPGTESRDGYEIDWVPSPMRLPRGQHSDASGYMESRAFARDLAAAAARRARGMDAHVVHALNTPAYAPTLAAARHAGARAVATVRDPAVLCPTGICMMDSPRDPPVACRTFPQLARCSATYGERTGFVLPAHKRLWHAARLYRARDRQRALLRRMDGCIAVSHAMARALASLGLVDAARVQVAYNFPAVIPPFGADEVRACAARHGLEGTPYWVVAGKKSLGKGTAIGVEAARMLARAVPGARVVFAGKGMAAAGDGVVDIPSLPQDELHRLMAGAAGLLVPSIWFEALHRGMLDALVMGLPLVVSSSGGPREGVVEGRNGFVVPPGDAAALAAAMERVLAGGEAFRDAARRTAAELLETRFSAPSILAALERIYRGDEGL